MKQGIPFFSNTLAAGFPSPAEDYREERLDFNEYIVRHPAATFCVRARGNSMEQAGIQTGDILVVDRAVSPRPDHIVVAVCGGEFTVKYLRRRRDEFFLEAANPLFPPVAFSEYEEILLWGVVTFVLRKTLPAAPAPGG